MAPPSAREIQKKHYTSYQHANFVFASDNTDPCKCVLT